MKLDLTTLQQAVNGSAAAFRCRRKLQPAGGAGDKVFPPTFAGAVYAVEQRRVRDQEGNLRPDPVTCVVLDTVQSQANRMEQALQDAFDGGRIKIPVLKVDFSAWSPTGSKSDGEKFIDDVGTITSLQVPHRLADAILRDSQTKEGIPFRKSEKGKALNTVSQRNATALYQLCPTALIFGMWDSTGPKGGLGAKFERAMVSEVVGVGATIQDTHKARGVRRDPLEIRKAVPILKAPDKSWSIAEPTTRGVEAPSAINHGSVPFDSDNAGTTIEYAEQVTTLSLIVLRRLCFPAGGASNSDADAAGRTVLAALGLLAATLAFESGLALRSRCLIWPEDRMTWELLAKPSEAPTTFSLSGDDAIALLKAAVAAAKAAKLDWEEKAIELVPQPKLADLVRLSQLEATKQRVRLPITPELENWILQNVAEAKRVIAAPIPAPLEHSPKCVRCSLAPVCLPDETRMLSLVSGHLTVAQTEATASRSDDNATARSDTNAPAADQGPTTTDKPRRLIAARDDTRPLYLNTPGYRVGCKSEVLTVKDKDKLVEEVRMRDVSHVALFGNIQISTQAIQSLCEQEVPVTYFSMGGWFYGITRGHALKNVFLRMEQFRLAREEKSCLSLARQFVHGKIRNHRTLLMRNHAAPLKQLG